MAQAEIRETLNIDKDRFWEVVTRIEDYPLFVPGCTSVEVERQGQGRTRVSYKVNMIKEVSYIVNQIEDAEKGTLEWTLESSPQMKKNNGRWQIQAAGPGKINVYYSLEVEFNMPVPSLILNRLIKSQLPEMIRSFAKQAQQKK